MEPGENVQGTMKLDGDSEEALFDFSVMLLEHLGSGEVRPMEYYQARFPGYEEEVAAEYSAICHVSPTELQGSVDLMGPEARYLGDLRIGNYLVERELGRGGQATVYAAKDLRMDRSVALKVLSTTFGRVAPDRMERFRREAAAVANIDHPCICDVFEADFESEPPYIAMRLVKGDSIRQHIQRAMLIKVGELDAERDPNFPCFPTDEGELHVLLRVFERLARALHAAHEDSVYHRDIKPANLILEELGTPMILDFGLARIGGEDSSTLTVTGEVFGTPAYMPPELLRGLVLEPGPSLDVYSLAVTLYECLTLKRPFDAGTPERVYKKILEEEAPSVLDFHPGLSKEVAVVLATALEKDLNRRYASALDFAEELRRICEHEPIVAAPAGPGLRLRRWLQRHPALGTSIAGSTLILIVGLTIALVLLDKVAEEKDKVATERDRKEELLVKVAEEQASREEVLQLYDLLVGDVETLYYREEARKKLMVDPVHALLLATEAYRRDPHELNHREVRRAIDSVNSVGRIRLPIHRDAKGMGFIQDVAPHPSEPWVFYNDIFNNLWRHNRETTETVNVIEMVGTTDGMRITYDDEGERLFVSRRMGEEKSRWADLIEVRTSDGEQVHFTVSVEGEEVFLLAVSSRWLVTSCTDRHDRLWDVETGELVHEFEDVHSTVWAAVDPSGARVARGQSSSDGGLNRVVVWDIKGERSSAAPPEHEAVTTDGGWSPSGDRLFTCSYDGASLWSAADGALIAEFEHSGECRSGVFNEEGSLLVTTTNEGEVRVWDGETGEASHQLVGHDDRAIISASFRPGSNHLFVTTSYDQTTRVWDVKEGVSVRLLLGALARPTPNNGTWWEGEEVRCLEEKGILHTWSIGGPLWPRELSSSTGEINDAWFIEGGEQILVTTNSGLVEVIDWRTGEALMSHSWSSKGVVVEHVDDVRGVVIARGKSGPRALEWNFKTGPERALIGEGPAIVEIIPFGEGDPRHLLRTELGLFEAWDLDADQWLYTINPSELPSERALALVSDSGRYVASSAEDGFVRIWNAQSGELHRELGPFASENGALWVAALEFSLDEEYIFVGCADARIRNWSIASGELVGLLATHTASQLIQVDENYLCLSAQYSGNVVIFDLDNELRKMDTHPSELTRLQIHIGPKSGSPIALSGDRQRLLFADGRSPVRILELREMLPATGTKDRSISGSLTIDPHVDGQMAHLSRPIFSPDSSTILTTGGGRAWLWPVDIVAAAEEASPVGIDFFGGFPSIGLSGGSVR